MGRIILALAGLIALCCLVMYAIFLRAPMIERDIETRTQQLLEAAGLAEVSAKADGRTLYLSGDNSQREMAIAVATEVFGVEGVTWQGGEPLAQIRPRPVQDEDLKVVQHRVDSEWSTQLELRDQRLIVSGDRPEQDAVSNAIVARLSAEIGGGNVSMEATNARNLPVYWADTVNAAANALRKMESGSATLQRNKLSIEGVVASDEQQASIKQMLVELTPSDVIWRTQFETLPAGAQEIIARLSPAQCDAEVSSYMIGKQVRFRKSKTSLQNSAFSIIDGVVEVLGRCPTAKVQIAGYTDSRGDADLNMRLSKERAETVRDYLIERGVSIARLDARGFGPQRPIASNKTAAGRAANRRIEFRVIGE